MADRIHHLIIFGAQGSGKGTQARRIVERLGVVPLVTGEIFREIAAEDSPLGHQMFETLAAGHLVPDDMVHETVALRLGGLPPSVGFILDGYPRNAVQAEELHRMLAGLGRLTPQPIFIYLDVPRDKLLVRLRKRRELEKRHDDTEEGITQRLKIYEEETAPILDSVTAWAKVLRINGDQPIQAVTEEIMEQLGA